MRRFLRLAAGVSQESLNRGEFNVDLEWKACVYTYWYLYVHSRTKLVKNNQDYFVGMEWCISWVGEIFMNSNCPPRRNDQFDRFPA